MRICIAMGPWLPVPALRGGSTGRIWQGLAEKFAQAGHEVTILAPTGEAQPEAEVLEGVNYRRVRGADQSGLILRDLIVDFFYAIRAWKKLPDADITVYHDFWLPLLLRKRQGSFVFIGRMPRGQFRFHPTQHHFLIASSAVEEKLREEVEDSVDRTYQVPCPVDDVFLAADWQRKRKSQTFLYVGRIHSEKGLDLLITSFAKLQSEFPDATLQITGPHNVGEGGGGEGYLNALKELAIGSNITFTSAEYDLQRLCDIYLSAEYFVYPSLAEAGETFGVAPLEAMAAGCIPIVSSLKCFSGHIQSERNGVVFNHHKAGTLYEAMKQVLYDTDRTQKLKFNARGDLARYSLQSVADEYLRIFQNI